MVTRFKIYLALVSFSATLAAARLAEPTIRRWRESFLRRDWHVPRPPVEQWPQVGFVVDPSLGCPTPVICIGSSHLDAHHIAPYEPCCNWQFHAVTKTDGHRFVRMCSGNGFTGESFELAFLPGHANDFEVRALGRAFWDWGPPFDGELQGITGTVTVNTLDWREGEPIHVRFELRYYYDEDPAKWSTIEVCSQATPTREE